MKTLTIILTLGTVLALPARADSPQQILALYQQQAGSASAARGEAFFHAKITRDGQTESCASCHTDNPKAAGKTRANKLIEPLAPVANRDRFTDPAKVEKWFRRNCKDVLARECSAQEKADFVAFLISVK
jgi:mono/diheme cytochrome c family protein